MQYIFDDNISSGTYFVNATNGTANDSRNNVYVGPEDIRWVNLTLPHCEVIPSDNREVVVLVTDTPDEATEDKLQKSLKNLQSLQSLSLAFGYDDKKKKER